MGYLRLVLAALLMTAFPSVYGGDCFKYEKDAFVFDVDDCRVKAEQGDTNSQYILGSMYGIGQEIQQDYKKSFMWYQRAAEQGNSDGQFGLGFMYGKGLGVIQDFKIAFMWFQRAAEQGHTSAQYNLGNMYYDGQGVPQDYVMAHMFWNISSGNGGEGAANNRDTVTKKMTLSQIAEAQKLAREWMRTHQ